MVGPSNYALDPVAGLYSSSVGTLKAVGGTISLRSPIEYFSLGIVYHYQCRQHQRCSVISVTSILLLTTSIFFRC